jgi:hypothetical protein
VLGNGGWDLTLTLLTSTKWWAPASASKWQMGFNSAFKGLRRLNVVSATQLFYHISNEEGNTFVRIFIGVKYVPTNFRDKNEKKAVLFDMKKSERYRCTMCAVGTLFIVLTSR